ncbi:hypothetical protein KBY97_03510 [Synechococcus sp. ATX 2A4]|uniref:hypothetical protein n=1 Tax=Synechococcus sp. ATX 2A4 TaxID=2823727 RepID=UPI0020CD2F57|nr:hypothetical protein [Synechococcus sp. ATX 2A4]MCP9884197.1 hypothetical protein [Synechococcus sp. ATX 2A4]
MNLEPLMLLLQGRRLVLHTGTTKTGSTSLQQYLFTNHAALKAQGILYPTSISTSDQPKHQWLIECLARRNQAALTSACEELGTELDEQVHTVVLSTEGLYNHFYDYIHTAKEGLAQLCASIDVEVVVVFRNPFDFSLSSFKQGLINPPNSWSPYYGHTRSLEQLCSDPKWLQRLNFQDFVETWRQLVGKEGMRCFPYSKAILKTLCKHILDFDVSSEHQLPNANRSVGLLGVDLLHVLNRHQLPSDPRALAIEHVRSIDALKKTPFTHSKISHAIVDRHCTASLLKLCATTPELTSMVGSHLQALSAWAGGMPIGFKRDRTDTAFLLCLEAGFIEEQTILLVQSLRLFGGCYSACPIYLVCPRPHRAPSKRTIQTLELMGTNVIIENLNHSLDHFPYANKAYALAHLEEHSNEQQIVFLDSDTLVLDEPRSLAISHQHDFAARPVDVRGICSSPLDNHYHSYWEQLCALAGVSIEALPCILTGVSKEAIHANYNGGLLVVRRSLGFGSRWQNLIEQAWEKEITPKPGNFWGSGQSTFAVAAHSISSRVHLLPEGYNIPLHSPAPGLDLPPPEHPKHAHYHWLLETEHFSQGLQQLLRLELSSHCRTFLQAMKPFQHRRGGSHTGFPESPQSAA